MHIPDVSADPEYGIPEASRSAGDLRTVLGVPLHARRIGRSASSHLSRIGVGPFTDRQIELVADLCRSGRDRHRERAAVRGGAGADAANWQRSLDDLRTAQDRLVQTEKLASLGQLTAGIAHEIKNPLNFVNNFSALSGELIDELQRALDRAPLEREPSATKSTS